MLDLDALPGLGFSAETIFEKSELPTSNVQLQCSTHQPQRRNNRFKSRPHPMLLRIGRTNKFFVEFGFSQGKLSSKDDYLRGQLNSMGRLRNFLS